MFSDFLFNDPLAPLLWTYLGGPGKVVAKSGMKGQLISPPPP